MPVDFFKRKFIDKTEAKEFGLCDDSIDGDTQPAYLDALEENCEKWIAIVNNESQLLVEFYSIDGFLYWKRIDGTDSGKCDGMLCFNDKKNIIFVELKCQSGDSWRSHGKSQLKETLEKFFSIYDRTQFLRVEARQIHPIRDTDSKIVYDGIHTVVLRVKRVIDIKE